MENLFDLGIIGGGPAGYSAAIRAAQKGLSVILFEKNSMGGVCLNRGCIPTKTFLHWADLYTEFKSGVKKEIYRAEELGFSFEKIFEEKETVCNKSAPNSVFGGSSIHLKNENVIIG